MNPQPARPARRVAVGVAAVALVGSAFLGACGDDDDASSSSTTEATTQTTEKETTTQSSAPAVTAEGIEINQPWARTSPAMTTAGAIYLEITNTSDVDDALLEASVDASLAGTVELHETTSDTSTDESSDTTMADDSATETTAMDGAAETTEGSDMGGGSGMMTMSPVDQIDILAGETVALAPGGYHIMLLDLVAPLEVGTTIEVTLTFENAGEVVVTADVLDTAP